LCEFSPECARIDEVHERPLAVDLDHRQPLAVPLLELVVPADVDLLEAVRAELCMQDGARLVAQAAARGVVQDDAGYG
jgi:hypothetical protein